MFFEVRSLKLTFVAIAAAAVVFAVVVVEAVVLAIVVVAIKIVVFVGANQDIKETKFVLFLLLLHRYFFC